MSYSPPFQIFNIMKYHIISLLLVMVFSQSCRNSAKCPFSFEIPAQLTPYSEAYQVGDTITVSSKFHKHVYDTNTDKTYDMEGIYWSPFLSVLRMDVDSLEDYPITKDYFEFFDVSNNSLKWFIYSDGASQLEGKYNYQNDTFDIQIKIVPKTNGLFYLRFASGLVKSSQDFPGKCRLTDFDVHVTMNEGSDNNIHLLHESPSPHFNEWKLAKPEDRFYQYGDFCFRVVE